MRKLVMLAVVLLGTSFMANAHVVKRNTRASKEVVLRHKKHKKHQKAATAQAEKPKAATEK